MKTNHKSTQIGTKLLQLNRSENNIHFPTGRRRSRQRLDCAGLTALLDGQGGRARRGPIEVARPPPAKAGVSSRTVARPTPHSAFRTPRSERRVGATDLTLQHFHALTAR